MILISLRNIKKSFGDIEVLKDVNLDIKKGEVIGLVGFNGEGKTTLANIIMGIDTYDCGYIEKTYNNIKIGYLRQSTFFESKNIYKKDNIKYIYETTSRLGLEKIKDWTIDKINNLSGGEKTKLAITEVFNEKPDLLILDEPTNHLDYVGINWLITELKKYDGSTLVISHDRYFLDQVTKSVAELDSGVITMYNGNYTYYRNEKQRNYDSQLHQYEQQKKIERHIDEEINRLKKWSYLAHRDSTKKEGFKEYYRVKAKKKDIQIKSAIKRLEKLRVEGVKRPKEESKVLFEFVSDEKMGRRIINACNLSKNYGNHELFINSDFYISRGEKVGLIGVNGCGKTSLIKMILGIDNDYTGLLEVSKSAKIAYLSQDVLDLNEEISVEEIICKYDKEKQTQVRTLLSCIGITERMIKQKIQFLSLGERTRIKIVFLIIEENNILILDEPTNHLDLHSREQLEKTLDEYNGTVIIASHDRYLLEKITNKLLFFENKRIRRYEVGFMEFNEKEKVNKNNKENELLIIENRITFVLSELSKYKSTDEMYTKLDNEFKDLIKKRKDFLKL